MPSFSQVFSKALFMRSTKAARKTSRLARHDYQKLEDRNLLASFSGTLGEDVIVIHYEGDRPASIEINGETFENADDTLELDLGDSRDSQSGNHDRLSLLGGDGHDVRFNESFPRELIINDSTFVNLRDRDDFFSPLDLETGDGEDTVDANRYGVRFFTGAGDDLVYFRNVTNAHSEIDLGPGNDRLIETSPEYAATGKMTGGEGYDTIESQINYVVEDDRVVQLGFIPAMFGGTTTHRNFHGFEEFVGTIEETTLRTEFDTLITGTTAWVYAPGLEDTPLKFQNVSHFHGGGAGSIYVHETAYPLTISQANVNLGGDFRNGNTTRIKHEVTLRFINVVIVSNSGSTDSQFVEVAKAQGNEHRLEITGLTPERLVLVSSHNSHINLAGSNTANDTFSVSNIYFHLILFGNGGDDHFQLESGSQNSANSVVNIIGGDGNDYLEIDDRSFSQQYYGINENWIYSPRNLPSDSTLFSGFFHSEVERTHLIANSNTDKFYITPSSETQYTITGGKLNQEFAKVFNLLQPYQGTFNFVDLGERKYTWYFGDNGAKFVHFRYHSPDS